MNKTRERVIIDGKELNAIQRYFFNKSSTYIILMVQVLPVLSSVFMFQIIYSSAKYGNFSLYNNEFLSLWLLTLIYFAVIFFRILRVVLINYVGDPEKVKKLINKSWLIDRKTAHEQLRTLMIRSTFSRNETTIEMLKNSSGHDVFDEIKIQYIEFFPEFIEYMDNVDNKIIRVALEQYAKTGNIPIFNTDINIDELPDSTLRYLYATAKGIKYNNLFTQKAISKISNVEMSRYLKSILNNN